MKAVSQHFVFILFPSKPQVRRLGIIAVHKNNVIVGAGFPRPQISKVPSVTTGRETRPLQNLLGYFYVPL